VVVVVVVAVTKVSVIIYYDKLILMIPVLYGIIPIIADML
jgi:hypothetical protein